MRSKQLGQLRLWIFLFSFGVFGFSSQVLADGNGVERGEEFGDELEMSRPLPPGYNLDLVRLFVQSCPELAQEMVVVDPSLSVERILERSDAKDCLQKVLEP